MTTKRQCEAAARRRWGGFGRAFVRENKNALTPAQREAAKQKHAVLRQREKDLESQRNALNHDWQVLLKAAEFWRDVDGGEPSTTELRAAIEKSRKYVDLCDELRDTKQERDGIKLYSWRYEAGYIGNMHELGSYASINEYADTLDELLRKIEPTRQMETVGTV